MNITNIISDVAYGLPSSAVNDLPMIRQALNDSIDSAVRAGPNDRTAGKQLVARQGSRKGSTSAFTETDLRSN